MIVSSDFVVACYVPNQYNRTAANNSISDNPIATTVLSRPFSGDNAASNATFSKIQNWMTECSKSHVHCQRRPENRSTQSLKARWLDLAHSKVSGLVALDSAEHLSTPPKYAALSYVWGRSQSLSIHQTTTANLQSHAHGLVLASMPKLSRTLYWFAPNWSYNISGSIDIVSSRTIQKMLQNNLASCRRFMPMPR